MNREMKDSGVQWIGEIPEGWGIKPIKQILQERKESNNPVKTDFILSLTMDKGVIPYNEKIAGGNKAKEDLSDYKLAYPKDIVLNSMNVIAGSVGLSKYFGCVSPVYYMLYPRSLENKVEYFNYIFQSSIFQKSLMGLGNGIMMKESSNGNLNTIRMRIPMSKLNTVEIPIPSEMEQEKIVNYLDEKVFEIDNAISKTKEIIEEYKKYKQSLITETVTKGLNKDIETKESRDKDWKKKKIKYIANLNPNYDKNLNENDEVSFIPMECLGNGSVKHTKNILKNVKGKYTYFSNEDIIIAKVTPCFENGNIAIVDNLFNEVGFGSSELYVLRCFGIDKKFMFYYLQNDYFKNECISTMTGTGGLKRVSLATIKNYIINVPNINKQQEIANYLDKKCLEIDNLIKKKEQLIKEVEDYKKSLIYETVTGKRVI